MSKHNSRLKVFIYGIIVVVGIFLIDLFKDMLGDNIKEILENTIGIPTKILLVIFAVVCFIAFIIVSRGIWKRSWQSDNESLSDQNIEPDVKRFFDSLKERYQNRYRQKLDGRFEISLEVSENWNGENSQTITEQFSKEASVGEAVKVINNAFEKEGCLLIVGKPGAGKTVLLLKLALDLLNNIKDLEKEPFPVIFNLVSWSPEYKKFEDWLRSILVSGNGLSKGFAEQLLLDERIIFLLDGLDELARNEDEKTASEKRAHCLRLLNSYLDRGKKVVICCRVNEFVQMHENTGQGAPVAAQVEILDLTKPQILLALEYALVDKDTRHHTSARNLSALLVKEEYDSLLEVLRTPFYYTTALEIFDRHIPEDNNFRESKTKLRKYLIEKFVERKLEKTPNPKNFKSEETRKWLKWLAQLMEKKEQVTFELADLQPKDLKRSWIFKLLLGIVTSMFLSSSFVLSMFLGPLTQSILASWIVLVILLLPPGLLFSFRIKNILTEDSSQFSFDPLYKWSTWKNILFPSLLYGLISSLIFGLLFLLSSIEIDVVVSSIRAVIIFGLIERISNYSRVIKKFGNFKKDYQRLKRGFIYSIIRWNIVLGCFFFVIWIIEGEHVRYAGLFLKVFPLILTLSILNTVIFKHFILRLCLTAANVIPLRYATFLNYAVKARILEKDGGQWRFRHQNLQEYFANLE